MTEKKTIFGGAPTRNSRNIIPDPPKFTFGSSSSSSDNFNPFSCPFTNAELFNKGQLLETPYPIKKRKIIEENSNLAEAIVIEEINITKINDGGSLIYSFKMHYNFGSVKYVSNKIINISVGKLDVRYKLDNYISFEEVKQFIKNLDNNETCSIELDTYLTIIYSKNTSEWLHNFMPIDPTIRTNIRIPMNKDLLDNFACTLKVELIDKISRYLSL